MSRRKDYPVFDAETGARVSIASVCCRHKAKYRTAEGRGVVLRSCSACGVKHSTAMHFAHARGPGGVGVGGGGETDLHLLACEVLAAHYGGDVDKLYPPTLDGVVYGIRYDASDARTGVYHEVVLCNGICAAKHNRLEQLQQEGQIKQVYQYNLTLREKSREHWLATHRSAPEEFLQELLRLRQHVIGEQVVEDLGGRIDDIGPTPEAKPKNPSAEAWRNARITEGVDGTVAERMAEDILSRAFKAGDSAGFGPISRVGWSPKAVEILADRYLKNLEDPRSLDQYDHARLVWLRPLVVAAMWRKVQ